MNNNKKLMCDKLSNQDWAPVYQSNNVNYTWTYMKDTISNILSCFDNIASDICASLFVKNDRKKPCPKNPI